MEKEIQKEENKLLIKKYTPEKAKEFVVDCFVLPGIDANHNLRIIANEIMPKFFSDNKEEQEEGQKRINEISLNVLRAFETETYIGLMEAVSEQYRSLAKELTIQIIKDYACKTSIEKLIAEDVVHSYIKVLDSSRRLNSQLNSGNTTSLLNTYMGILSKQADRAHRQFLNALMTLKQIKTPLIEMNIKTNNAFVAQNQQINADKKINEAK